MFVGSGRMVLDDLAEPSRRAILDHLRTGEKSVGMLVEITGMKQPNVSNHLARMRERGVVSATRHGRQVFYQLADPVVRALLDVAVSTHAAPDAEALTHEEMQMLSLRYLDAAVCGNESVASQVVTECIARRVKLESLYVDILQEAMQRIGGLDTSPHVCEARAQVATALTERLASRASLYYPVSRPNGMRCVLGSPQDNRHSLGLRLIADVLQQQGWDTLFVGCGVPHASLVDMVRHEEPELVLLSCTMDAHAEPVRALIADLHRLRQTDRREFRIGIGGAYVNTCPRFVEASGADFTAADARSIGPRIDRLFS